MVKTIEIRGPRSKLSVALHALLSLQVYEQGPPVLYCNESDNQLKNFKPFDLEEYWGQRLVQNIHVTTTQAGGHQ